MKKISENTKLLLSLKRKVAWNAIYENEQELIEDMLDDNLQLNGTLPNVCKGYEYIKSFRKYYLKDGRLTDKQLTQLKRLAKEIAYNLYCK